MKAVPDLNCNFFSTLMTNKSRGNPGGEIFLMWNCLTYKTFHEIWTRGLNSKQESLTPCSKLCWPINRLANSAPFFLFHRVFCLPVDRWSFYPFFAELFTVSQFCRHLCWQASIVARRRRRHLPKVQLSQEVSVLDPFYALCKLKRWISTICSFFSAGTGVVYILHLASG